jgi:hypothetical protein
MKKIFAIALLATIIVAIYFMWFRNEAVSETPYTENFSGTVAMISMRCDGLHMLVDSLAESDQIPFMLGALAFWHHGYISGRYDQQGYLPLEASAPVMANVLAAAGKYCEENPEGTLTGPNLYEFLLRLEAEYR